MPRELRPGDVVRCRSEYVSSALGVGGALGIVLDVRGGSAKVLYPDADRRFWMPADSLATQRGSGVPAGTRLDRLRRILGALRPEEAEVELAGPGGIATVRAHLFELPHPVLDAIREDLGDAFVRFTVVPEGMAVLVLELVFRMSE